MFPSAANTNSQKDAEGPQKWLENQSFEKEAACLLRKKHQPAIDTVSVDYKLANDDVENDSESSSDSAEVDVVNTSSNLLQPVSEATTLSSSFDNEITIDRSCDKNNLYFTKPYKVFIPKFYRCSSSCIGLPSYYAIQFKEQKRKKRKVALERYFHLNNIQEIHADNEMFQSTIKSETEQLNIITREHPENILAWMELVRLQDKIGSKNVKIVAEKKISILDKAISVNPLNLQLKLKRLQLCESISQDCERDWKDLVFQHPGNRKSWEAYINHVKKGTQHVVARTMKAFERAIQTLAAINDGSFQPKEPCPEAEADLVAIFRDLVQFLAETGHTELCVTMLVVMVEVNVRTLKCASLSAVRDFYVSGEPLLGEERSSGWDAWFLKHEKGGWVSAGDEAGGTEGDDDEDDEADVDFDKSVAENWLMIEENRSLRQLSAWRSKEECEDLSRKVNFDEIQGFVFFPKETCSKISILRLLVSFLGVKTENVRDDDFLISSPCHATHARHACCSPGEPTHLDLLCDATSCRCGILPDRPHHEFARRLFDQLHSTCPAAHKQLVASVCLDYYAARLAAISGRKDHKGDLKRLHKQARSAARGLLQNDPVNFALWRKLARIEALAGKWEDGKKVVFNALFSCKEKKSALLICREFASLEFERDVEAVKKVLSALGDERDFLGYLRAKKEVSGAVVLRAARNLQRQCEELSCLYKQVKVEDEGNPSEFANLICCYGIYLKITNSEVSARTFQPYVDSLREENKTGNLQAKVDLNCVHSVIIRLVEQDHKHHNAFRNTLLSALDDSPDNPGFALQLCQVDIGSSVSSVARRIFGGLDSTPRSFLYAVYFELLRNSGRKNDAGSPEEKNASQAPPRVSNILERAVNAHCGSVLLWRLYARLSRDPRTVLIRATAACPWSKKIACDRVSLSSETVDDVVKYIRDQGIRLRTPVEEINLLLTL